MLVEALPAGWNRAVFDTPDDPRLDDPMVYGGAPLPGDVLIAPRLGWLPLLREQLRALGELVQDRALRMRADWHGACGATEAQIPVGIEKGGLADARPPFSISMVYTITIRC